MNITRISLAVFIGLVSVPALAANQRFDEAFGSDAKAPTAAMSQTSSDPGWYFGLFGGAAWLPDVTSNQPLDQDNSVTRYNPGYRVGGSLGYDFNDHFGIEAELAYANLGANWMTVTDIPTQIVQLDQAITGSTGVLTLLANAIARTQHGRLRPYIGGGIGGALVMPNLVIFPGVKGVNDVDLTFAAQAFVGADWDVSPSWSIGVRYNVTYLGPTNFSDYQGGPVKSDASYLQSVMLTLRHPFGSPDGGK